MSRLPDGPPGPDGAPLAEGPRPQLVIEIDAQLSRQVADAASRSLVIACLGALLLLGAALAAARWLALRDREAQARARDKHLASLGEMSAVLAHELRNPLASLKGNAQLLAEDLDGPPRERADVVVDEAVRLEALTAGLLEFVRTGAIERRDVDPAALVRAAAGEVDGARVDVDATAAPTRWSLDPERFRQVLVNVLRNAVEASPPGAHVDARVGLDRGALRVTIRDRGPGIAAGQQEAIFQPFHTSKTRGTGLGLAVARRIVELHRGTIQASTASDGGAVIDVTIPG
ncbi:MAG: HAMP domain-containing histidine kinase [Kofleriaceae bacterium]|nr:HAMP domain-containing histidine kinase [Kofleriaceae bacterium]